MKFWQRLLVTAVAVLVVGFLADLLTQQLFGFGLPAYLAGVIGGLVAVPLWELLRRMRLEQR